jgi:hypothetical protein
MSVLFFPLKSFLFMFLLVLFLLLSSTMAESFCCFWTCNRNPVWRLVFTLAYTHCRELMKSVGKLWWRSHYHTCHCWLSLKKWETITVIDMANDYFMFCLCRILLCPQFCKSFSGSLDLKKFEPCSGFLNCEDGDFSILTRDIVLTLVLVWLQ